MRKEYEVKYLIGFEIEYDYFILFGRFSIKNGLITVEYRNDENSDWDLSWEDFLNRPKLIIDGHYLYYSGNSIYVTTEFMVKLESFYKYNKRKKIIENLGI